MKEIIDLLKKYTDGKKNTEKVEVSVLNLNRIIKALELTNVPVTNVGDLISRQAVIQIIENKLNPCTDMFKCLEIGRKWEE